MTGADGHPVDLAALRRAIAQERFAGAVLTIAARDRLIILVTQLAAAGPLTPGLLGRYMLPLLAPFAEDRRNLRHSLEAALAGLVLQPPTEPPAPPPPRRLFRALALALAIAGLLAGAVAVWMAWPRPAESGAAQEQAETVAAPLPVPAAVAQAAPPRARTITENDAENLVRIAALPAASALEVALHFPSLAWLQAAVTENGWSATMPMPLHDRPFVTRVLGVGAEGQSTAERQRMARLAEMISAEAATAPTARLWKEIEAQPDVFATGPGKVFADPVLHAVYDKPAGKPMTTAEIYALATETYDPKDGFGTAYLDTNTGQMVERPRQIDQRVFERQSKEAVMRAFAIGSFELGRPMFVEDPPWQVASDDISMFDTYWNWILSALSLVVGLAIWLLFLWRLPLWLERSASARGVREIPLETRAIPSLLGPWWLARWRETLSRSVSLERTTDIDRTVRATAAAGGILALRQRARPGPARYDIAIEQRHRRDTFAAWWTRVFQALAADGIDLRLAVFRDSLAKARMIGGGGLLRGESDGGARRTLVFAAFDEADARRGIGREVDGFVIAPGTAVRRSGPAGPSTQRLLAGLAAMLEKLTGYDGSAREASAFLFATDRDWLDETPLGAGVWRDLQGSLYLYLGADGLRWLCACAVFPTVSETIAWEAARSLGIATDSARAVAARLFATPWLRAGHFPRHLRRRLIECLGPQDLATLHAYMVGQLERADSGAPDDAALHIASRDGSGVGFDDPVLTRFIVAPPRTRGYPVARLSARLRGMLLPGLWERMAHRQSLALLAVVVAVTALSFNLATPLLPGSAAYWASRAITAAMIGISGGVGVYALRVCLRMLSEPSGRDAPAWHRSAVGIVALRYLLLMAGMTLMVSTLSVMRIGALGYMIDSGGTISIGDRAQIVDRNGETLAAYTKGYSLFFDGTLPLIESPPAVAAKLRGIFPELDADTLARRLSGNRQMLIKRYISAEQAVRVDAIGEPALRLPADRVRFYPNGSLAAHVLGHVRDDTGVAGIEIAMGNRLTNEALRYEPLELSIDLRVQAALEAELAKGIEASKAKAASGIVLDANTGEVVAMGVLPTYNPNAPGQSDSAALFNSATNGVYEFGAAIMPFTIAAAIEQGVAEARYPATPLRVGDVTIRDTVQPAASLTLDEALARSSSVVAARLSDKLGAERLMQTFQALGFDKRPSIESPSRAAPLWPASWSRVTGLTTAYGQGFAITPLHLATAYAALVNGGIMRPATFLKRAPQQVPRGQRVFSEATSSVMRDLLRRSVTQGSGRKADVPGLRVGGKGGSSAKAAAAGYSPDRIIASFAAAFPMDRPRYVVVIVFDEPKGSEGTAFLRTSAFTAAPVAGRVIERIRPFLGVPLETDSQVRDEFLSGVAR